MIECELCGRKAATRKAEIEGAVINVCEDCVDFGKEIPVIRVKKTKKEPKLEGMEKEIVEGVDLIIKKERAKLNLDQKELAKKIGERTSVIKRVEGGWVPPLNIIEKLEKFFSLKLTEEFKQEKVKKKAEKKELTIGDIVEVS